MDFKYTLAALFLLSAISSTSNATLIITPFAADLDSSSYSDSAHYFSDTAESAFNGGIWNAGGVGYHWIQADMGMSQSLTEIILTIAQAPNGYTEHQIFLSDSFIGSGYSSLTAIYSHAGSTTHGQILDVLFTAPVSGRYLQIVSYGGNTSWTALGDNAGRVNWEQPAVSTVPAPTVLWLLGSGLIGLIGFSRCKNS